MRAHPDPPGATQVPSPDRGLRWHGVGLPAAVLAVSAIGPLLRRARRGLSRAAILLTLLLGHLCAGLFLANFDQGLAQIDEPRIRQLALLVHRLFEALAVQHRGVRLTVLALALLVIVLQMRGQALGWFVDLFGGLLLLRCAIQFLMLNLLLLSPMRAGALLLSQLLLFLPVITIAFGWLYWRLDSGARRCGRSHIRFSDAGDTISRFDSFHLAVTMLLSFEPSGATASTRLMKTLFLLHGLVMLDLVALTLSRAIGLASGQG